MSKKYDFSTVEGRRDIWKKLDKSESKNARTCIVGKIKNLAIALLFAFNNLLFMGYLCDLLVKAEEIVSDMINKVPVLNSFTHFAAGYTDDNIWKALLFGFVFVVVVPAVIGLVLRIILFLIIRKKATTASFPEEEDKQIDAILSRSNTISVKADAFKAPFGVMFGSAIINTIAGCVFSIVMINDGKAAMSVSDWIGFAILVVIALVIMLVFAFCSSFAFTYPVSSNVKAAYEKQKKQIEEEREAKEREERLAREKEEARKEKEKLDAMTAEELYNYACEIEDNHEQLKLLRMAEKRGYKDACYMITVVERMIEEEQYKKSKACMDAGWAAQDRGDYRLAKRKFLDAAHLDNPEGMYNYARLCLKDGERQEAIRWLEKAIASGTYDDEHSRQLLAAMKRGEHINITD